MSTAYEPFRYRGLRPSPSDMIPNRAPHRGFQRWLLVALLSIVAGLAGCDLIGEDDDVVEGVNLDELFARPSLAEIAAIEQEWEDRDVAAVDAEIVHDDSLIAAGWSASVAVIRHRVGAVDHFGAVIIPRLDEGRSRAVLVYLHGNDDGVSIKGEIDLLMAGSTQVRDSFIVVVPSFRSEPLRVGDHTFTSDGPPSPWNFDVDDALALLEATIALYPQADEDRIAAIGFSRGATVAMLMAIRDARIDGVVEYFGVTDFYGSFAQEVVRDALRGRRHAFPAVDYLDETVIQPLKNGRKTIGDVRAELTRRSPLHFADRLPALQIHHGEMDDVVPVSEANALIDVLKDLDAVHFESYLYADGTHHPLTLNGSLGRTTDFLLRVIASGRNPVL